MPKHRPESGWQPKLRRHASGQGCCRLSGKDYYLGSWPSSAKHPPAAVVQAYERRIAEWLSAGRQAPSSQDMTITELILRYLQHAKQLYRKVDASGVLQPTSEFNLVETALDSLDALYGSTQAKDFRAGSLKAYRAHLEGLVSLANAARAGKLTRHTVNAYVSKVKRMFSWAAEEGEEVFEEAALVRARVFAVRSLKFGQTEAPDRPPVREPAHADFEKVVALAGEPVKTMLLLQSCSGMRPGELIILRAEEIDRACEPWEYRPARHKTQHLGKERHVFFGPRARALLAPLLDAVPSGILFRTASQKKPFSRHRFWQCLKEACLKAGVPHIHPHQLRHLAATEAHRQFDLSHSAAMLGDTVEVARGYSHARDEKARTVAEKIG